MDETIRRRHRELVKALKETPLVGPAPQRDWADHYEGNALMVRPDGSRLEGLANIATFLNGPAGLRTIQSTLLQAERGTTGYALAAFNVDGPPPQAGTSMTVYVSHDDTWRIVADIYGWAGGPPNAFEEWKECRSSIDRFDKLIADVRKYGFTLITGLLTASAFAFAKLDGGGLTPAGRVGASVVLMILVFGLFTVDRYLEIFLRAAVTRARELEQSLALSLTRMISAVAEGSGTSTWATWLYTLFMVSAMVPWLVSSPTSPDDSRAVISPELTRSVVIIGSAFTVLIWIYHFWTRWGLQAGLEGGTLLRTKRFRLSLLIGVPLLVVFVYGLRAWGRGQSIWAVVDSDFWCVLNTLAEALKVLRQLAGF